MELIKLMALVVLMIMTVMIMVDVSCIVKVVVVALPLLLVMVLMMTDGRLLVWVSHEQERLEKVDDASTELMVGDGNNIR